MFQLIKKSYADDFDIRIYTDAAGFGKENPNGIFQIEGRYRFQLNSGELAGGGWLWRLFPLYAAEAGALSTILLLSDSSHASSDKWVAVSGIVIPFLVAAFSPTVPTEAISPFVGFTRVENRINYVPPFQTLTNSKFTSYVNTFDLLKYANLNVGLHTNILNSRIWNTQLKTSVTIGAFRTPTDSLFDFDSTKRLTNETDLLSWYIQPEFSFTPISTEHIEFITTYSLMLTKLIDHLQNGNVLPQVLNGSFIQKVQVDFNIYNDITNRDTWLFARGALSWNGGKSNLQLQLGYASSLAKLLGATE